MSGRRILSLWFPRLAAERVQRIRQDVLPLPLAVVTEVNGAQLLASLSPEAEAAGLRPGQPLRDATAICPGLLTVPADPLAEARFLGVLRRWAGRFSPWVSDEPPDSLMVDLTGSAHLFGGERAVLARVAEDCAGLGLTLRAAIADTPGAAWALARFARSMAAPLRSGDAIDQEARATRSRAAKRRGWERGGFAPRPEAPQGGEEAPIVPPGQTAEALRSLPLAALRLPGDVVERLMRLGLRQVGELILMPRAALARRFGMETLRRLDQALGMEPEPVNPVRPPMHFATRLTLPDPIGLRADVEAALDRLLPPLCEALQTRGRGVRRLLFQAFRADGGVAAVELGLARAANTPDRIRPLLHLKLDQIDAGFGIDCLRLEALATEALAPLQHRGPIDLAPDRRRTNPHALDDLVGRLSARLGEGAVTRLHPAESHVPAKCAQVLSVGWSQPHEGPWPAPAAPRPLILFRPEVLDAPASSGVPARFRWRRQEFALRMAAGPERLQAEWWLEDPDWREGARDYWRVEAEAGERLWLFYGRGGAVTDGWYCEGIFA